MRKVILNGFFVTLCVLMAGCAIKKPKDTSNPEASIKWLNFALDESAKSAHNNSKIKLLQQIYVHAEQLKAAHTNTAEVVSFFETRQQQLQAIPQQVLPISIQVKNKDAYFWALDLNPAPEPSYADVLQLWPLGSSWIKPTIESCPATLSLFISQAIDEYEVRFFDKNAEAFKASGYAVSSPLQKREFMTRYCIFIAKALSNAAAKKDTERINFLIDHTPDFRSVSQTGPVTQKNMHNFSDYVLYDLHDEALACKLMDMGYEFDGIDLDRLEPSNSFLKILSANPETAIRALSLDRPGPPLTKSQASFLISLPIKKLMNLNTKHVAEAIQMCLETGGTSQAIQFINLRAAQKPLERADYVELLNWSIRYNDKTIYDLVIKHGGDVDMNDIDLSILAYNQKMFEMRAPKFLRNIHNSMNPEPVENGITLGTIYQIFESSNQKAGLFIVKKYDLADDWKATTGDKTLLMDACRAGNLEVVRHLIERRKANVSEKTHSVEKQTTLFGNSVPEEGALSAIFFAAMSGNSELITYLKSKGANINARSNFGATPLMFAVSNGRLEATKTLIALGASVNMQMDVNYKDYIAGYAEVSSAYNRAQAGRHEEILEVLRKAGARP